LEAAERPQTQVIALWLQMLAQSVWAGASGGQFPILNTQNFRPSLDSTSMVWTDDSAIGPSGLLFRSLLSYTNDPLVYTFDDGQRVGLVSDVMQLDLMPSLRFGPGRFGPGRFGPGRFGLGRFGGARVGLDVPLIALAHTAELTSPGIGDIRLDGKVVVLDAAASTLGLGLDGGIGLPTGMLRGLGAGETTWDASVILDKQVAASRVALNLGVRGGPRRSLETVTLALENIALDDAITARLGYAYGLDRVTFLPAGRSAGRSAGCSVELTAMQPLTTSFTDPAALSAEWMLGGWMRIGGTVLRAGAGTGLTHGIGTPDLRVVVGVGYERPEGPPDRDHDGVPNRGDGCDRDPEDHDGVDDNDGCPELDATDRVD
jgi:hypothetical protein